MGWLDAFIGHGVTVGDGVVVGARLRYSETSSHGLLSPAAPLAYEDADLGGRVCCGTMKRHCTVKMSVNADWLQEEQRTDRFFAEL